MKNLVAMPAGQQVCLNQVHVCLFVCLLACLLVCLFVCLFLSFLLSLFVCLHQIGFAEDVRWHVLGIFNIGHVLVSGRLRLFGAN